MQLCRNRCGRYSFGAYDTCCTNCKGADGPHARDCAAKSDEARSKKKAQPGLKTDSARTSLRAKSSSPAPSSRVKATGSSPAASPSTGATPAVLDEDRAVKKSTSSPRASAALDKRPSSSPRPSSAASGTSPVAARAKIAAVSATASPKAKTKSTASPRDRVRRRISQQTVAGIVEDDFDAGIQVEDPGSTAGSGGYGGEVADQSLMGKLNFRRLVKEFRGVKDASKKGDLAYLPVCELREDNVLTWDAEMTFPEGSSLQQSLEELARIVFDAQQNRIYFQVRFPNEYPFSPPEVWIKKPRLKYKQAPVTFGGKVCNPLLTSNGWEASVPMTMVFEQVRQALVDAGAEVDIMVSRRSKGYQEAQPAVLDRLSSAMIPQVGSFRKENVHVMSAAEAELWVGDVRRLEYSDKIMLPMDFAERVYGADAFVEGIMFEVKTRGGRKVHCALENFLQGLPNDFMLMPGWVMEDIFLEERDTVTVKTVQLAPCSYVKIQPHSVDFYEAVNQSGKDPKALLQQSIRRCSALTLDTNVPIEIAGKDYMVCIVELQPAAAVKLIGHGTMTINVDFDPAPALEDEAEKEQREQELVARWKARQEEGKSKKSDAEEKRTAAIHRHYGRIVEEYSVEAGADDGKEGPVEVRVRLPGGQLTGRFREGASAIALFAFVLRSDWATQNFPWGVQLTIFPCTVLKETDTIGQEVKHKEAVNVREVAAPPDEEIFQAEPEPTVVAASAVSCDEEDVPLDEAKVLARSTREFEIQRFLRNGITRDEAERRYDSGDLLPPDPGQVAASQRTALPRLTGQRTQASTARQQARPAARRRNSADLQAEARALGEREGKIEIVTSLCGIPRHVAENFLERYNWDEQRAVNEALNEFTGGGAVGSPTAGGRGRGAGRGRGGKGDGGGRAGGRASDDVQALIRMGFTEQQARTALEMHPNNVERAAEFLLTS